MKSHIENSKKIFPSADELSKVVTEVKCSKCDSQFSNTSHLAMHLAKSHKVVELLEKKIGEYQFFCPKEGCKYFSKAGDSDSRFFSKFKYLKQHYQKVHLAKIFKCVECGNSFSTENALTSHRTKDCLAKFSCAGCNCAYSSRTSLLTHCKRKSHPIPKPIKSQKKCTQSAVKILPKLPDCGPMEGIAAAALRELSEKVVVRVGVDASVQTDHRCRSRKRIKKFTKTHTHKPIVSSSTQTDPSFATESFLFPQSFTSSTQTQGQDLNFDLGVFPDIDQHVNNHTQTELDHSLMLDDDSPVLSNTHTQTMDLDDYSHNYTQTCHDIFLNDFVELTDIETQTAWASLTVDPLLVSAETQTLL